MRSKWWLWVVGVLAAVLPAAAQTYPNLNARTVTVGIPGTTPMVFLSDTGITPQTSGGSALGPAMLFGTDTPTDGVSVTAAPNTFYLSSDGHTYWKVTGSGTTGWVKVLDCTVGASGGCILNLPQMTLGNNSPQLYDPYDGPGAPTGSTFAYEFAGAIGATLYRGFDLQTLWNPSGTMTNDGQGLISFAGIVGTQNGTGHYRPIQGSARSTTTGTVTGESGGYFSVERSGGPTLSGAGITILNIAEAGATIGANYGMEIDTPALVGGGAITNNYGLQIDDQTVAGATLSDAIKYDSPTDATFILRSDGTMSGGLALVGDGEDDGWAGGIAPSISISNDESVWNECMTSTGAGKSNSTCEYTTDDGSHYVYVDNDATYFGYDVGDSRWESDQPLALGNVQYTNVDGTNHQVLMTDGTGGATFETVTFAELGSTPTTFSGYGISDTLANLLTAVSATISGNTTELASASGAFVSGNCVKSDANHNLVDAGGACGGGGGSGTVTSVDMSVPTGFAIAGNPITTSGTLALTLSNETANSVMAGPPTTGSAAPTFRALVVADLPTITSAQVNTSIWTGTASSGPLAASSQGVLAALTVGAGLNYTGTTLKNSFVTPRGVFADGQGSALAAQILGTALYFPNACTITSVSLSADLSGSATVDLWVAGSHTIPTVTNTITASDKPALSSAQSLVKSSFTGWTLTVAADSYMIVHLDSATTITKLGVQVGCAPN